MIAAVHTTGINAESWAALAGPILVVLGAIGRILAKKVNQVGEHLKDQDKRHIKLAERMARVEGKVGLNPLPIDRSEEME